ncbi:MAG: phosphoglucosamine mutase [Burkholderiales bacterium]|jgi:phosphoglucosamine mutase|nr:phosphoglucosamine mutase [Burkholderiales bacterium]
MRKYFGTDGIRGLVGNFPITPDFALRLGYAAGVVLGKHGDRPSVIIGKDTRLSGYLFESSLEAGLSYAGVDVYMAGPIPTPAIAYLANTLTLSAGIVISASHNPYMDNGIKFFSGKGTKLPDDIELEIEAVLDQKMVKAENLGKVVRLEDAQGRYIEFCKNTFNRGLNLKGMTIVLDCANGATYKVAPSVFRELGASVIPIACEPDGLNINRACGSTHPNSVIAAVLKHKADLGIALDGDGDRVLFVDKSGNQYDGDKILYIILRSYLAQNKEIPGIVGTVMTNLGLEHKLAQMNIELIRTKVGDRYILEELERRSWSLGGEASGHILCLDSHTTGDGIISALQVLAAVKILGLSLDKIIDYVDYQQVMINVKLEDGSPNWQQRSESIIKEAQAALGADGRLVVRASGTEPLVRVMVEAKDEAMADSWAHKIATVVKG